MMSMLTLLGLSLASPQSRRTGHDKVFVLEVDREVEAPFGSIPSDFVEYSCSRQPKVALCIYGLVRSVHTTRSTLQQHVRLPLRNIGGTDTFVHTLLRSVINDPRSNEHDVGLHPADFLFLGPMCRFTAEDGDAIDARELLNASILNAVYAKTNVSYPVGTLKNWLRAMYSLKMVAEMAIAHEEKGSFQYRLVAAVRPDTAFLTELPRQQLDFLFQAREAHVLVPDFHHYGGVNDRFALGTRNAMFFAHMDRLARLKKMLISRAQGLGTYSNSEGLLCRQLLANRIRVLLANLCVVRVRTNGDCPSGDFLAHFEGSVNSFCGQLLASKPNISAIAWPCANKSCPTGAVRG